MRYPHIFYYISPGLALVVVLLVGLAVWLFNAHRLGKLKKGPQTGRNWVLLCGGLLVLLLLVFLVT